MDHGDEKNELLLQFQILQKQQEKKKLDRKKAKEAHKLNVKVTQDDSVQLKEGNLPGRWVLQSLI